jgi:hypothetical protein
MLQRQHLALLFLVSLLTLGCNKGVSSHQPSESAVQQTAQSSIDEASTKDSTKSAKLRSGTFVSGEHATQGTVRILTQNGKHSLELDQAFKTSEMGPDLVVILHRSANVIGSTKPPAYSLKKGDYTIIAPLKKFSGAQSYSIPQTIKLDNYQSVAIWCRKFNATFGAAKLSS